MFTAVDSETRQKQRLAEINRLLEGSGIECDTLQPATLYYLDKWARQIMVVRDQPSANWEEAVVNLGKAAEAELATTLGGRPQLAFLAQPGALGPKIQELKARRAVAEAAVGGEDAAKKINAVIEALNEIRPVRNDVAHGKPVPRSLTANDGRAAELKLKKVLRALGACR